jgi:transketolase
MMTAFCVEAAKMLDQQGIDAEVVHLASIKPIDRELIASSVSKTGCAVTAENATVVGGFGSAVAEVLAETTPVPLARIGVQDRFVTSGGIGDLFRIHGMLPEDIVRAAHSVLERKIR